MHLGFGLDPLICRVPDLRRLEVRGPGSDSALASVLVVADGDKKKSMAAEVWGHISRTGESHCNAFGPYYQDLGFSLQASGFRIQVLLAGALAGSAAGSGLGLASVLALPDDDEKKSTAAEVWGHMGRTDDSHCDAFGPCLQNI